MKIAVTGFVAMEAGSVASANAILLRGLLAREIEVDFFSKPSFVDPRPAAEGHPRFRFVDCTNHQADQTRRRLAKIPVMGSAALRWDVASYNHLLVHRIREEQRRRGYDLVLWMGDYARGRVPGVPTVSFVQGPPGTDARSIIERGFEIRRLAGLMAWLKWRVLALLRLSRLGLPALHFSDHLIVGSNQSKRTLNQRYEIPGQRISTLPYPIDLKHFQPPSDLQSPTSEAAEGNGSDPRAGEQPPGLRILWLGRIIPRKRLDLFLDGAALAIQRGLDISITIVGRIGLIPGYEKLISAFPYPQRLAWHQSVPRANVPELMRCHDVMVQPSDEENFGSSVAEAQACGLPVIVGRTNGNADYLSARDIHLANDGPDTFALALEEMTRKKQRGELADPAESRRCAERYFDPDSLCNRLLAILETVVREGAG